MGRIARENKGEIWPSAKPGVDGTNYGSVQLSPQGRFEVRSFQTFSFTFTVGDHGLDDTGAIKIVQRWTPDGGALQAADPTAANYVTASASAEVHLEIHCEPYPHQRPWYNGVRVTVLRGYLAPGDTITVVYGNTAGGGPGYRLQTFPETHHEFMVLVDPCATGVFIPLDAPAIMIEAGDPHSWVLVAPTLCKPGETFSIGLKCEDRWGNACSRFNGSLQLRANGDVMGLPSDIMWPEEARGHMVGDLSIENEGVTRFELLNDQGQAIAISNPLVIREDAVSSFWGDLHGQSGETVGIDTLREYMTFARDVAFLDVTSHQANDFQVTNAFWSEINDVCRDFNQDGIFTVFPGYEWSGNTPVGGDHNVFFKDEDRQIRRSSHALLEDRSDIHTDAANLKALFSGLRDEDCVLFAHIGGRPADISYAENAALRTAVEVHSDWGTFEWVLTDAFELGYRVGLVCNSDGHKGAPGACYPGASEFGAYSGLTCYVSGENTRDAIFDCLRRRHHYGTTGCRMHLDVTAHFSEPATLFERDPRLGSGPTHTISTAMMGDIVETNVDAIDLTIEIAAHAPLERVDILNGAACVATWRPYEVNDLGRRVRVIWQGAEYRGRGRQTHWRGALSVEGTEIERFQKINIWNHERLFEQQSPNRIGFEAVTTGNFSGCDLWLSEIRGSTLEIETDIVSARLDLSTLDVEDHTFDAGGLDRKLRVFRLPDELGTSDAMFLKQLSLRPSVDNPIWVRVKTEDGFVAWSSPIYLIAPKS